MMLSMPDLRTPKHILTLSTLSLSNSPLSSSTATLARRNSYNNIPDPAPPISAATLCRSLAADTITADPRNNRPPSHPPTTNSDVSGQEYTNPCNKIISNIELTFLIAYRTPLKPLKPFSFDSIDSLSSKRKHNV
ncbi:hypothetical protein VIGAN_03164500 [Vigna angularis var. angularis]|uniref:Uncharacterized protein n=1 Tax=Vigna angularis var. angularis TaxID=157739 RepID=A0A0S3RME6_PHAAN|nr:hypothetical protein VIGAN_03164500 [Vigna angularis var. angularis]